MVVIYRKIQIWKEWTLPLAPDLSQQLIFWTTGMMEFYSGTTIKSGSLFRSNFKRTDFQIPLQTEEDSQVLSLWSLLICLERAIRRTINYPSSRKLNQNMKLEKMIFQMWKCKGRSLKMTRLKKLRILQLSSSGMRWSCKNRNSKMKSRKSGCTGIHKFKK